MDGEVLLDAEAGSIFMDALPTTSLDGGVAIEQGRVDSPCAIHLSGSFHEIVPK